MDISFCMCSIGGEDMSFDPRCREVGLIDLLAFFHKMSTVRCARGVCIDVSTAVIPTSYGVYG